jgi:DNA-binding transcriptional ArsR family regulator
MAWFLYKEVLMFGPVASAARQTEEPELTSAAELFRALSSPIRLFVVLELAVEPRCVHELSDAIRRSGRDVSQPLLSQHLRVLRDTGLVTTTRRATEVTYGLVDDRIGRIVQDAIGHAPKDEPLAPPTSMIDDMFVPSAAGTGAESPLT